MSVEQLRARVREEGLIAPGGPLLAMYSGGRDSTCLLDVAVSLLGPERVRALHVNYGLRADAGGDEEHCRGLCEQLGVELHVHTATAGQPAQAGNLQAWAREVRYREAGRLAAERGALFATGHTASDQVETIVYRLAASPGRRALLGMPAREGLLVRPLLCVTREQTADYCREAGHDRMRLMVVNDVRLSDRFYDEGINRIEAKTPEMYPVAQNFYRERAVTASERRGAERQQRRGRDLGHRAR